RSSGMWPRASRWARLAPMRSRAAPAPGRGTSTAATAASWACPCTKPRSCSSRWGGSSEMAVPNASSVSVLLAGGTGLVGRQALRQLLGDSWVREVRVLVRREMSPEQLLGKDLAAIQPPQSLDKLRICVTNFERLEARTDWFAVDWVLCALGSTIARAG